MRVNPPSIRDQNMMAAPFDLDAQIGFSKRPAARNLKYVGR